MGCKATCLALAKPVKQCYNAQDMRRVYIFCKDCSKVVEKWSCDHQLPSSSRGAAPLAVYFEGPNGEISVPGQPNSPMPKRLQKLGYEVKTIQNSHQYSQVMKHMDKDARRKHEVAMERLHQQHEQRQKAVREELRRRMTTQFGKDFLEMAIREAEKRGYADQNYGAGSHIEAYEYDGRYGRD